MNHNKIPVINQKFDFFTFIKVLKKSLWIIGILLAVGLIIGFLYIRYTPPVYQASAVIQVRTQNKTNEILGLEEMYETGLDPVIELLRSQEFLKRCFSMLPLEISYYKVGTFLSYELYKTSPFEVNYQISQPDLLNTKIYVHFNKNNIELTYPYKGKEHNITLIPNQWTDIPGGRIKIQISDYDQISFYQNHFNKEGYYFIINDEKSIIESYSKRLNVNILNKSARTIRIAFEDKSARKTADVVNTISMEFLKYEVEKKKESANNIIDYIDKQLGVVMNQMDSTEKKLNEFQKDNRLTDQNSPPLSGTKQHIFRTNLGIPNIATRISDFQNELINLEFEISTLNHISNQISSKSDVNVYELIARLSGTRSEDFMKSMLNSMMDLYNERNILLNDVTENNYKIKTIDKQIQTKKEQIIDYINMVLVQLEQSKKYYENKINELEAKAYNDSSFNDIEQARLERLFSINENFYHQLIQKKAEYMISQAGYVSDNIILESANIPKYRIKPSRKKILLMAILITALISFFIIIVRYLFYNKISTVQEISTFTDIPVIGAIPLYSRRTEHSHLVVHKNPKSVLTESFRNIRSNMAFMVGKKSSSMITISSTISGEGKTFIAINLGGILAMANKNVILLDLDLRKPRFHKSFGFDNNKGISTILIGKHSIDECIHGTEIDNLKVIASGPIPPNPSELLLTNKYNQILDALKKQYDYIVVDTPPVGIVTDAIRSFQDSDYAFYVIRVDHSPRTFLSYINNLAESKSLNNLSLILNGMDESSGKYGYGYGYHYGYSSYGYGQSYGYREYLTNTKDYYDDLVLKKRKLTLKNLFRRKRKK
ncbi:MAG: GumC family protein [Bacteroidales bacterium]